MNCALPVVRFRIEKLRREAIKVLGSAELADAWLHTQNAALGGATPDSMVNTLDEFQQAMAELSVD